MTSICGGCAGSGGRAVSGADAAPTSASRDTISGGKRPSRFGGQLSRNFVDSGSIRFRWSVTIAAVVMMPPTLGAQNQSLPPAALIFCI